MRFIFHPGDWPHGEQLGGKAGALAALQDRGLAIPEWFVILPDAFDASLSAEDRQTLVPEASVGESRVFLPCLQPAPALLAELNSALAKLCPDGESVAVRSSAREEDGCAHSFAGQLESFLTVPLAEVPAAVVAVWKSAFSERVRAYRAAHRLPGPPGPPSVLIQRMVHADAAGVAFGADPITGRPDIAVVSAVPGLGTALVNGERNADTWHVDATGQIAKCHTPGREPAHAPGAAGQPPSINAREDASRPVLDDAQVRAVAALVRRTGELRGHPQDIEWAFEKDRLYLLQSRPITTPLPRGERNIWDNSNIIESYSGVTLPLTFSFARRAYTGVYRQFCQMLAVPKARIAAHEHTFRHMLGLIRGRVYYNLLNWYRVLALLPGFTLNRRFMEQMMGVKEELPAEALAGVSNTSASARIQDARDVAVSLAALVANHFLLPRKIRRFYQRLDDALAPPVVPLETMTADELSAYFLQLEKKLLSHWDAPLLNDFFAMIFFGVLRRLLARWVNDLEGTLQNDLLCAEGGMISAEPAERIRAMSELAATKADVVKQLCDGSLATAISALETIPRLQSAYQAYLVKFGDRCLGELKLESWTLHDDPLLLIRSIGHLARQHLTAERLPPTTGKSDVRPRADTRVRQALARHALRSLVFHWVLRHTRARVRDRENLRFERTRLFGRVRRIFVELGRRLHTAGRLQDPRDVFLLEVDEVLGFVAGTSTLTDLKGLVALRHREFADYQATAPPPNRFTTHGIVGCHTVWMDAPAVSPGAEGQERTGLGCCPGVVRGRVRKIIDPRHAVLQPGEILVAERTDPGWILLFPAAAGLLVERGSLLSHSAIVAREMRIPAIVSIDGLMAWLDDGDQVEFDGGTGVIRRTEAAGAAAGELPASISRDPKVVLSMNAPASEVTIVAL